MGRLELPIGAKALGPPAVEWEKGQNAMNVFGKCLGSAALVLAIGSVAHATTLGFNSEPAAAPWNRGDANAAHAVWDSFPSFTYSGDAADSIGGFSSATASQSTVPTASQITQGAGTYETFNGMSATPGTDLLYTSSVATAFTFSTSLGFSATDVYLQVKRGQSIEAMNGTPLLNGRAAVSLLPLVTGSGDTTSTAGTYAVSTWYWDAASLAGTDTANLVLTYSVGSSSQRRVIDGFALDVAAVPEPVSFGLFGTAGALLLARRRRDRIA